MLEVRTVLTSIQSQRMYVELWVAHPGENRKTTLTEEAVEAAEPSAQNIPIVGFWNSDDFEGHEFRLVWNDDTIQQEYAGTIIGVVPESNNYRVEEKDGKMWTVVEGFIWTEYANYCLPALQNGKQISMEIDILGLMEEEDKTIITSFAYKGICVLGDHRTPAITGAKLEIVDKNLYEIKMKKGEELMDKQLENYENTTEEVVEEVVEETVVEEITAVEETENYEEPKTEIIDQSVSSVSSVTTRTTEKEGDDYISKSQTITVEEYISRYEVLEAEHNALLASYEVLQTENTSLKNKVLETVANEFADVTTYEEVSKMEGSIENIELQLYALRGKKASVANYAVDTQAPTKTSSATEWYDLIK